MGRPLTFPTGTVALRSGQVPAATRCSATPKHGIILIDMNGKPVHVWHGLDGFPAKMLPGGRVMASRGRRSPPPAIRTSWIW